MISKLLHYWISNLSGCILSFPFLIISPPIVSVMKLMRRLSEVNPLGAGLQGRKGGLRAAGDQPILVSVLLLVVVYLLGKEKSQHLIRYKTKTSVHHLTLLTWKFLYFFFFSLVMMSVHQECLNQVSQSL